MLTTSSSRAFPGDSAGLAAPSVSMATSGRTSRGAVALANGVPGVIEIGVKGNDQAYQYLIARFWDELDNDAYGFIWIDEMRVNWTKDDNDTDFLFSAQKIFLYRNEQNKIQGMAWYSNLPHDLHLKDGTIIPRREIVEASMVLHANARGKTIGAQLMEQRAQYLLNHTKKQYMFGQVHKSNPLQLDRISRSTRWKSIGYDEKTGMHHFLFPLVREAGTRPAVKRQRSGKQPDQGKLVNRQRPSTIREKEDEASSILFSAFSSSLSSLDEQEVASLNRAYDAGRIGRQDDQTVSASQLRTAHWVNSHAVAGDSDTGSDDDLYLEPPDEELAFDMLEAMDIEDNSSYETESDRDSDLHEDRMDQDHHRQRKRDASDMPPRFVDKVKRNPGERADGLREDDPSLRALRDLLRLNCGAGTEGHFSADTLNYMLGWRNGALSKLLDPDNGARLSTDMLAHANRRIRLMRRAGNIVEGIPRQKMKPPRADTLHMPARMMMLPPHEGKRNFKWAEARWQRRWEHYTDEPRRTIIDIQRMNQWTDAALVAQLKIGYHAISKIFRHDGENHVTDFIATRINRLKQSIESRQEIEYLPSGSLRPREWKDDIFCWPKGVSRLLTTAEARLKTERQQSEISPFDELCSYNAPLPESKMGPLFGISASTKGSIAKSVNPQRLTADICAQINAHLSSAVVVAKTIQNGMQRKDKISSADDVLFLPPGFQPLKEVTEAEHLFYLRAKNRALFGLIDREGDIPKTQLDDFITLNGWSTTQFVDYFKLTRKTAFLARQPGGVLTDEMVNKINAVISQKLRNPRHVIDLSATPDKAAQKKPAGTLVLPDGAFRVISHATWCKQHGVAWPSD